jgi:hypothetical protein
MAMRSHATKTIDPPFPVPRENLRQLPNGPIWLYETCDDFGSITVDAFARRIPGCSVVICRCADRNATVILDLNARIEKTY